MVFVRSLRQPTARETEARSAKFSLPAAGEEKKGGKLRAAPSFSVPSQGRLMLIVKPLK